MLCSSKKRRFDRTLFLSLILLAIFAITNTQAVVTTRVPAPKIESKSYILVDHLTTSVLAEENADERVEPASLAKIMTIYAAGHALQSELIALDDKVKISEKAWRMGGSRMFIEAGNHVSVDELLDGVIVQSGNDASVALAEHVYGTEEVFATVMNEHARQLGMTGSNFSNSTGLPDPNTYTTARDIVLLSAALITEFPRLYARFSMPEFTYNGIRQVNRNKLLFRDDTIDGIKTGRTKSAGYCLVSSAERDGMRLIAAVMGTGSSARRTQGSLSLINYGFRFFETRELYKRKDIIASAKVWKGNMRQLNLSSPSLVYVTILRGRYNDLVAVAQIKEPIIAPISIGQVLGEMNISLDGALVSQIQLVAAQKIEESEFLSRLYDELMLFFE